MAGVKDVCGVEGETGGDSSAVCDGFAAVSAQRAPACTDGLARSIVRRDAGGDSVVDAWSLWFRGSFLHAAASGFSLVSCLFASNGHNTGRSHKGASTPSSCPAVALSCFDMAAWDMQRVCCAGAVVAGVDWGRVCRPWVAHVDPLSRVHGSVW